VVTVAPVVSPWLRPTVYGVLLVQVTEMVDEALIAAPE
jgi:hypothetical protein